MTRIARLLGLVGMVVTILVFLATAGAGRAEYDAARHEMGADVTERFSEVFDLAEERLFGIEGFFSASEFVTAAEFTDYVDHIGLVPGMTGIGYIDTVSPGSLGRFVTAATAEYGEYKPFRLDDAMEPHPISLGSTHQLLVYAEPLDAFGDMLGLDFASLPAVMPTLDRAAELEAPMASPLFDQSGRGAAREFLVVVPIGGEAGGYGAALVDLDLLVATAISDRIDDGDTLVIDQVMGGASPPADGQWSTVIVQGGIGWQFTIEPGGPYSPWTPGRVTLLVLGLLVSFGVATIVRLMAANRAVRAEARASAMAAAQTDRLLASVSHDLRTPLTGILGFLDELAHRWDEIPEEDRLTMVTTAELGAEEMEALIADLLVRERMLAHVPLGLESDPVDLVDLVSTVLTRIDGGAHELLTTETVHVVVGDRDRLAQAVRGLVKEASGPQHLPVTVTLETVEDRVRLEISSGRRFGRCCLPHLLVVGSSCRIHGPSAGGIGPAVARYIAIAMGGDVVYDVPRGSFVFELDPAAVVTDATLVA